MGDEPCVRRRLVVRGRVQGVFFRDTVRRAAENHGVAGFARNGAGGEVEVALEGPPEAVAAVAEVCRRGPPDARVGTVEERAEAPEGLQGFRVL